MVEMPGTQPIMLHMIGNAHIDPVWQWRWPEGCAEAISTCWAAVDRLEEDPGFIFTRGEALVYSWIKELDPPLFARIRDYIQQGRWIVVNGWWIQPDCNLPAGEAFIRQALSGKTFFREQFGIDVTVGYNVDSFGHARTLPMLLRHTGFDSYVFLRPGIHEKDLPATPFAWVAPDGSRVCTARLIESYNTGEELAARITHFADLARDLRYPLMCFYGVGNHGGGPTRAHLQAIHAAQEAGQPVLFSDPVRYFAALAAYPLPEVQDELQIHAIGCYAAVSAVKQLNRRAEALLAQAEAAAALALRFAGASYPRERLRHLWDVLLFNQFHDILGGTCPPGATRDTLEALSGVIQESEEILHLHLRKLAATVTPGPEPTDAAFLVFNLTGSPQRVLLEYEPWLDNRPEPRHLLDDANQEIPSQDLSPEGFVPGIGIRRLLFPTSIPPFGYRLYRFALGTPHAESSWSCQVTATTLENACWRLDIDPATGGIAALTDKSTGRALFSGLAHLPIAVADPSDTWSHGLERFGYEGTVPTCESCEIVERGPLRAGLRVQVRLAHSTITSTYLLAADPTFPLEIRVVIDWHEQQQLLRLRYPLALTAPTFRYEVPAGSLVRPANGREWPGLRWVLARGEDGAGLIFANDAKYSYAAQDTTFFITALRSPVYAHHDPYQLQPGVRYPITDQGKQEFTLRLLAGQDLDALAAAHLADELLRPPVPIPHVSRGGTGPHCASLLPIEAHSSVVTWLKAAENGDDLIVRLLEMTGESDAVTILPGQPTCLLSPYSIATLRLSSQGTVQENDGLERPL